MFQQKCRLYATYFLKFTTLALGLGGLDGALSFCYAKSDTLLICLGREEEAYHRAKNTGAAYQLNQKLIAKLVTSGGVRPKPQYLRKICHSKDFVPSVEFLRTVLLGGGAVFEAPKTGRPNFDSQYRADMQILYEETPRLFFDYLSSLQSLVTHAGCLSQAMPEIDYFMGRYKYLEIDYSTKQLIDDRAKVEQIFKKLKDLDQIVGQCQKEVKQKSKRVSGANR